MELCEFGWWKLSGPGPVVSLPPLSSQSMREALLEETAAGPAVGPCRCSVAAAPVHTARLWTGRARRPPALPGMLGPALTLALLVLTGRQSQGEGPCLHREGLNWPQGSGSGPVPLDEAAAAVIWNEAEQPLTAVDPGWDQQG